MITKERLLLQVCCAPCASHVLEVLSPDFDITVYFYNPNIEPFSEYKKRREQIDILLSKMGLTHRIMLFECNYDNKMFCFFSDSKRELFEGGARCDACFKLRLGTTAKVAKAEGFDLFATTLTVSPHKNSKKINEIGLEFSQMYDIRYLVSDFKKKAGYQRSIELSRLHGIYRQNYCGCLSKKL